MTVGTNRHNFIRNLAAALPVGTAATQIEPEIDPIRAAFLLLMEAKAGSILKMTRIRRLLKVLHVKGAAEFQL